MQTQNYLSIFSFLSFFFSDYIIILFDVLTCTFLFVVVVDYMVYDDRQYLHNGIIMSVAIWICGRTIRKLWRSKMYIMCVCLFSALSRRVGALQMSIIIICRACTEFDSEEISGRGVGVAKLSST